MQRHWIRLAVGLAFGVGIIFLPRTVAADGGANCRSLGNCGEVRDGLPGHLATNPLNWKCVKSEFRPMFPALPPCLSNTVEMKKPVKMPITLGAPQTPGVMQNK